MIEYENLREDVKSRLSEKRFSHSEGVVKRAIEYAKIYGEDEEKVKLVAIAHDIAKEISEKQIDMYIKKYNIEFDSIEKVNQSLVHAKIGACICKDEYGFTDDMADAVKYHTTGRKNMSTLEKIIYLADATEEGRTYLDKKYVDIIKNDIDVGMVQISKFVISNLLDRNKVIHPNSIDCYNYYINKVFSI